MAWRMLGERPGGQLRMHGPNEEHEYAREKEGDFFKSKFVKFQIVNAIGYAITFALALLLVFYLRRTRKTAYNGSVEATQKVVLPAFEPLLWIVCIVSGLYTLYFIVAMTVHIDTPMDPSVFLQVLYQGRQCLFYLIAAFMMQPSVSPRALRIALAIALSLSAIQIALLASNMPHDKGDIAQGVYLGVVSLGFLYLFIRPPAYRASKAAWRLFCFFVLLYYATVFSYIALFDFGAIRTGTAMVFITSVWSSLLPYFIWKLLLADTKYWRDLANEALLIQDATSNEQSTRDITTAHGLQVLLRVHQQEVIDFAHLKLQSKIGTGSSSTVFSGLLRSRLPVAIKVYTPTVISKLTISEFSKETALCAIFNHPNIAAFYGMCVSPPSICLVFELCAGSLEQLLYASNSIIVEPLWPQLCYMLDAARAVAYLHSFSPPFVHRDIKPANFLIDANYVVKLTDFGESRNTVTWVSDCGTDATDSLRTMTVRGTADYMAPEIIEGKRGKAIYSESVDIYSLAITFWDILHPGREKYSMCHSNYLQIYEMVLDGQRPPIDPELNLTLQNILENGWCSMPEYRPSARQIVEQLECLQRDVLSKIIPRLQQLLHYVSPAKTLPNDYKVDQFVVSGEILVNCLTQYGFATCSEQAVRFGNSLMDAGFLHHVKHTKPFDNSASTYFFDNKAIQTTVSLSHKGNKPESSNGQGSSLCMCVKLAQGHFGMTKTTLFRSQQLPSDHHTLTMHLLNDIGDEEAVVVSRP